MPKVREHWQGNSIQEPSKPTARQAFHGLFARLETLDNLIKQLEDKLSYALTPPMSRPTGAGTMGSEPNQQPESELLGAITNLGDHMDDMFARLADIIRRAQV